MNPKEEGVVLDFEVREEVTKVNRGYTRIVARRSAWVVATTFEKAESEALTHKPRGEGVRILETSRHEDKMARRVHLMWIYRRTN